MISRSTQNLTPNYNCDGDRSANVDSVSGANLAYAYDQADRLTNYTNGNSNYYPYNQFGNISGIAKAVPQHAGRVISFMVAQPAPEQSDRLRMSVDEWRALERASTGVKHEYIDGYVYAMAGGTSTHAHIAFNAASVLNAAFGEGPCIAYMSDLAARLSATRYTYPDVVVSCDGDDAPSRNRTELESPRVVFQVLSESTERHDRTRKFGYYRACDSLQEYVLVSTEQHSVEVYRRLSHGWGLFHIYGPDDGVELRSIGISFPVAALYRRTDVPRTLPE